MKFFIVEHIDNSDGENESFETYLLSFLTSIWDIIDSDTVVEFPITLPPQPNIPCILNPMSNVLSPTPLRDFKVDLVVALPQTIDTLRLTIFFCNYPLTHSFY